MEKREIELSDEYQYPKIEGDLIGKRIVIESYHEHWDDEDGMWWRYDDTEIDSPYTGDALTIEKIEDGVIYLDGGCGFKFRLAFK